MDRIYQALFRAGINVDFIQSNDPALLKDNFAPYKMVFAPDLMILTDQAAGALSRFVEKGGVLFTNSRSAVKDATNLCYDRTLPGFMSEVLGITIEEYESLGHEWGGDQGFTYQVVGTAGFPGSFTATQTAEWVQTRGAEILAGYQEWHMQEYAALTRNRSGKGWGYFLGTVIAEAGFYDQMMAEILEKAGVKPVVIPPAGVECSLRIGEGRQLLFLLNHTEEMQTVNVPEAKRILMGGAGETGKTIVLDRYGVAVIRL
jgi:beta-galactosidase